MYSWSERSKNRMEGVEIVLIECATGALQMSNHDMMVPPYGGFRTAEKQHKIFEKGNSTLDGYTHKSYHQSGMALDVIPVEGTYSNDEAFRHFAACMFEYWQMMIQSGRVQKGYVLEWGGHWQKFIDKPHWQIVEKFPS